MFEPSLDDGPARFAVSASTTKRVPRASTIHTRTVSPTLVRVQHGPQHSLRQEKKNPGVAP